MSIGESIKRIKIKIPNFQEKYDPEAYLNWEKKIEIIFNCQVYSEEHKVKLTVIKLTNYAILGGIRLTLIGGGIGSRLFVHGTSFGL